MLVLSEEELIDLTKKERPSAQARVLDFMGIPYRPRPGTRGRIASLAVFRIHIETPDYRPAKIGRPEPELEP